MHGGNGNDQLFGGAGNDILTVNGNGSNTLDGGEGDDKLTVNRSTDYYYQRNIAQHMNNTLWGGSVMTVWKAVSVPILTCLTG
ncbi:hypothetical protein [Aeromonas hydrophila]|uniref:hypothetical protein n=1 Tax=Aeromonas hydrophila TaxID=644 RepID=UPI0038B89954